MHDVIVVGAGIFGQVIARHLRELGQDVLVVDDRRKDAGSAPAGCVIKPSWVSALNQKQMEPCLELLDNYYGLDYVEFQMQPAMKIDITCNRVEPSKILGDAKPLIKKITAVVTGDNYGMVTTADDHSLSARRVIVAAGVWTPALCPWVETWGRYGWSFRGPSIPRPIISMWAPYRQVVAFCMDDGRSWSGDGSALKKPSEAKFDAAHERCSKVVGAEVGDGTQGIRPYAKLAKGEPCVVSRRGNIIAVTGGAKNGTIAAAWAAREVQRELGL